MSENKPPPWEPHDGPRPDLPPWHPENVAQPGDTEEQVFLKARAAYLALRPARR